MERIVYKKLRGRELLWPKKKREKAIDTRLIRDWDNIKRGQTNEREDDCIGDVVVELGGYL